MTDKIYRGDPDTYAVEVQLPSGRIERLDPRYDLANHSPTGFSWGYGGSGPSQLAIALAADVLHDDGRALAVYQTFKQVFIAKIDQGAPWEYGESYLDKALKEIERDFAHPLLNR